MKKKSLRCVLVLSSVILLFSNCSFCFGQSVLKMIEEIQSIPDSKDLAGTWKIGGQEMTAIARTQFELTSKPSVGSLAEVYFMQQGKELVVLGLKPHPVVANDVFDGPYVFWKDEKTAEVVTLFKGKVRRAIHQNIVEPKTIGIEGLPEFERSIVLDPRKPEPPKSAWPMPSRMMAISDLEGNYQNAITFLQNSKVIDAKGKWAFGDGHLVLDGDLVDRGMMVTETMWLFRRLEREARKAGGDVHYILGNHETMVMGADLRYIHPKYHFVTNRLKIPYNELYSPKSDIGRWWRSKNAVETVGDLLFIHGGYSPKLEAQKLTMDALNEKVRACLPPKTKILLAEPAALAALKVEENPVQHQHGPFWYRGYFERYAAGWEGLATKAQILENLGRHKAKYVVVGHTVVDHVGPVGDSGAVIGIDTKWTIKEKCEGLLAEGGKLYRVTMSGEKIEL